MGEHTREQGIRVHHLANLGGLVALAGLDREPPDFLLGVLVSAAREAATLTAGERGDLEAGVAVVDARSRAPFAAPIQRADETADRGYGRKRPGESGSAFGGADPPVEGGGQCAGRSV